MGELLELGSEMIRSHWMWENCNDMNDDLVMIRYPLRLINRR